MATLADREEVAARKLARRFACGLMQRDPVTGTYTITGRGTTVAMDLTLEDVEGWIENGHLQHALGKLHH
jgi:hypothetical protein